MEAADRILSQLLTATRTSQAAKDRAIIDSGLTKAQYNALLLLDENPGSTASQLAKLAQQTQQAMAATVKRLASAGFVESQESPHGGRSKTLRLTERGRTCLSIADERVCELDDALRSAIAPLAAADLQEALARLRQASLDHLTD